MLEFDHVFVLVSDAEGASVRLAEIGWTLDAGQVHHGQGTRNRRLALGDCFLELLWVIDPREARDSPLRMDRRADWSSTGASPFGLVFRGRADRLSDEYWLYDALGPRIWIHKDNDAHPERPMVLTFEASDEQVVGRRQQLREYAAATGQSASALRRIRMSGPAKPCLPPYVGPDIHHVAGPHSMELLLDEQQRSARPITELLSIR